jgi:hypothetical protein
MSIPARTNSAAVVSILGTNYDNRRKPSLSGFIATASDVVDQVLAISKQKSRVKNLGGLTPTTLQNIEMWLAAHFYCIQDPLYMTRSTQGASGGFQRSTAKEGFASTDYGKQALACDWSGCLCNINDKSFATALATHGKHDHDDEYCNGTGEGQ